MYTIFLHAFSGCDITSAIFQKKKRTRFKVLTQSACKEVIVRTFDNPASTPGAIIKVGNRFLSVCMVNVKKIL